MAVPPTVAAAGRPSVTVPPASPAAGYTWTLRTLENGGCEVRLQMLTQSGAQWSDGPSQAQVRVRRKHDAGLSPAQRRLRALAVSSIAVCVLLFLCLLATLVPQTESRPAVDAGGHSRGIV